MQGRKYNIGFIRRENSRNERARERKTIEKREGVRKRRRERESAR